MTVPLSEFFKDPRIEPRQGIISLDEINRRAQQQAEPPTGFFRSMRNFAVNFAYTARAKQELAHEAKGEVLPDKAVGHVDIDSPEERALVDRIKAGMLSAREQRDLVFDDYVDSFSAGMKDAAGQVVRALKSPAALKEIVMHPIVSGGQFLKAFTEPITDAYDLSVGIDMTNGTFNVLTPEERAAKAKNVAATVAAALATGGAAKALTTAPKVVGEATTVRQALEVVAEATKPGAVAREVRNNVLVRGLGMGAAGGATYGAVRYAGEENQLEEILINGVVFAPLGAAFELVGIKGQASKIRDRNKANAWKAAQLANLRQVQALVNDTQWGINQKVRGLATADELAMALIGDKVTLGDKEFVRLNGVSVDNALTLKRIHRDVVVRQQGKAFDPKAPVDALIMGSDPAMQRTLSQADKDFFVETGFVKNEHVTVHGQEGFVVIGKVDTQAGSTLKLENAKTGQIFHAPPSVVSALPNVKLGTDPFKFASPLSLKARFLRELEMMEGERAPADPSWQLPPNANATTFVRANKSALDQAATGQPISFIGFRQQRGTPITGTGRFYQLGAEGLDAYSEVVKGSNKFKSMAASKAGVGPPDKLIMHRLTFENPVMFPGRQSTAVENIIKDPAKYGVLDSEVKQLQAALSVKEKTLGESGYQLIDKIMKRIFHDRLGHDGIIYRAWQGFDLAEVVDLKDKPIWDKSAFVEARRVGTATETNFLRKLYENWTDSFVDRYWTADVPEPKPLSRSSWRDDDIGYVLANGATDSLSWQRLHDLKGALTDDNMYQSMLDVAELMDGKQYVGEFNTPEGRAAALKAIDEEIAERAGQAKKAPPRNTAGFQSEMARYGETGKWNERILEKPFRESVDDYALAHGFTHDDLPALYTHFQKELWSDFANAKQDLLEPEEIAFIDKMKEEAGALNDEIHGVEKGRSQITARNIARIANEHGMYVDVEDAGRVVIRDLDSDKILTRATTMDEAASFMRKSGAADGVDLDKDFSVPPPPDAPITGPGTWPDDPNPRGNMEEFLHDLTLAAPWFTENRQVFQSLDTRFNTQLFAKVFNPLQDARRKANVTINPWYARLQKEVENVAIKLGKKDREVVSELLETMSPEQVVAQFIPNRKMNAVEQMVAKALSDEDIDIKMVFEARDQVKRLKKDYEAGDPKLKEEIDKAFAARGLDVNHQRYVELFDELEMMNKKEASLGAIIRLSRAYKGDGTRPELDRNAFIKERGLSERQLSAAKAAEKLYDDLAKEHGIPAGAFVQQYLTHARLYTGGNLSKAIDQFSGLGDSADFLKKIGRTGEISAFERDPVIALQRYIKSSFDAKHFIDNLRTAQKDAQDIIRTMPEDVRSAVTRVVNYYVTDLRGQPGAYNRLAQSAIDDMIDRSGMQISVDLRKDIVGAVLATGEAAAQGGRIAAGLRDLTTGVGLSYARFGSGFTSDVLRYGARGLDGITAKDLEQLGVMNVASPLTFADPTERAGRALGSAFGGFTRGMNKLSTGLFRLSGQKDAYRLLHAGAYLAMWKRAGAALSDLNAGKITPVELRRRLKLDTFQEPVIQEFQRLVKAGDNEGAARFLGIQTGYELVGVYGMANMPHGWGTAVGKIAGQFMKWPIWYRSIWQQGVSRGTLGQRMAFMARYAAFHSLVLGIGAKAGFDMFSWNPLNGLAIEGGPAVDLYQSVVEAIFGYGTKKDEGQSRLRRFLPYDPASGRFNIGQIYMPGSYMVRDYARALELVQQGFNPLAVAGQAIGIPVVTDRRSELDRLIGERPRVFPRRERVR